MTDRRTLLQAAQAADTTFGAELAPLLATLWALMPLLQIAGGLTWVVVQRQRAKQRDHTVRLRNYETRIAALEARATVKPRPPGRIEESP